MALKKHRLEVSMEEDFYLLGLVSDEADYRLCWQLNRTLDTGFCKEDDLEVYHKKGDRNQYFSLFQWEDETAMISYRIISNRSEDGFLLDELKNLDYLMHIQGEVSENLVESFIQAVQSVQGVRMCVPVDPARLRQRERLQLW